MIRLKNGTEVEYMEEFDAYFQSIIRSIIKTSLRTAADRLEKGQGGGAFNDNLMREIMDNCIYIARQIQEMGGKDEKLQSLLVTASLFNCAIASLSKLGSLGGDDGAGKEEGPLH